MFTTQFPCRYSGRMAGENQMAVTHVLAAKYVDAMAGQRAPRIAALSAHVDVCQRLRASLTGHATVSRCYAYTCVAPAMLTFVNTRPRPVNMGNGPQSRRWW